MDTTHFIEAFKTLPTRHERHAALEALVHELTPHEWRRLHSLTSARSFQFDIIGQLPLELVANVFSHLDTTTPYRLQLVSKTWAHLLRSLDVLKAGLNQWYAGTVDLKSAEYASCEQKARIIHNFRHGEPTTIYSIRPSHPVHSIALVGDTLIWGLNPPSPDRLRSLHLLDLAAWNLRTLAGAGREEIRSWIASDQIVALATFPNFLYVSSLQGEGQKRFTVPSSQYFATLTCRARTVACAATSGDRISVCILDYDTQQTKSFQINRPPLYSSFEIHRQRRTTSPLALLLQPDTMTILVFDVEDRFGTHGHGSIQYSRFTYNGECISTSHSPSQGQAINFMPGPREPLVPVDQKGQFALRTVARYGDGTLAPVRLRFDERLNHFTTIDDPASKGRLWIADSNAWWKDTFYGLPLSTTEPLIQLMLAHLGTSGVPDLNPLVYLPRSRDELRAISAIRQEHGHHFDMYRGKIVMNQDYVVKKTKDFIYVLCFDDSNKRPKQNGSFFDVGDLQVVGRSAVDG